MHRTRLSTLLGATAAAAMLVLTAGCGSSSDTSADTKSSDSSSASKDSGSDEAASLTKSDIFTELTKAQKDAGSYKFTLTTAGGQGTGVADVSGDTPNVSVKLGTGAQGIETRQVDGIFYFKSAIFGTQKWVKVDPKSESGKAIVGQFGGTSDPGSTLKALGDAAAVKKVGSKTIDGDETTEYDVTVPSSALIKSSKLDANTAKLLPKELTYQLFVGEKNLLRQMVIDLEVSGQKSTTTIDFTDYGTDVDVSAPPASETETNFKFPGAAQ